MEALEAPFAAYGDQEWEIIGQLDQGSWSTIFEAVKRKTDVATVLKLESRTTWPSRLEKEWETYEQISNRMVGFARPSHMFEQDQFRVMVMPLLGPSLDGLLELCEMKFSLKTVLLVADQLLYRLQNLHGLGIVHRDISLTNCVLGLDKAGNVVYLLDFGLSANINDMGFVAGRPPERVQLVGTLMFASLSAYHGKGTSSFDDLESLAYLLIYVRKGCLPWSHLSDHLQVFELKRQLRSEEIYEGLEPEFAELLMYARQRRTPQPDYAKLRRRFRRLFAKEKFNFQFDYDWTRQVYASLKEVHS